MFFSYQGYWIFFLQAKRKYATKTFPVYNNEVVPFLGRIATILYHSTWAKAGVGGCGKQVVSQAVGNCWIHRFLSQQMNCYILYETDFCFVGLFFMTMIMFQWNNSWRRKTVREDIIEPYVNFFIIILCIRSQQKGKYLSLPPYWCSYFSVISAQTCACHYRHQRYASALLALSMCQELVPMLIQLIKTVNRF